MAMYPQDGIDSESLLEKADRLMYESKNEAKRLRAGLCLAEAAGSARPVDLPHFSARAAIVETGTLTSTGPAR
jgi:hypothetical protein